MNRELESSSSSTLTTTQQIFVDENIQEISISYPKTLAKLNYIFSVDKRIALENLYRETEITQSSIQTLSSIPEISSLVLSSPDKDILNNDPEAFISEYNAIIKALENYQSSIDVQVLIDIFTSIRDSAEIYTETGRYDLFEARYDNIYSELDKELEKALIGYKDEVLNRINSLKNQISRF